MILIVDYNKEKNNVYISTENSSGAIYDVNPNNVSKNIASAVHLYVQDYMKVGDLS